MAKGVTKQLPTSIQEATAKIDEYARGMISGSGSTLFEELGLYYIGPIDGHSVQGAHHCGSHVPDNVSSAMQTARSHKSDWCSTRRCKWSLHVLSCTFICLSCPHRSDEFGF